MPDLTDDNNGDVVESRNWRADDAVGSAVGLPRLSTRSFRAGVIGLLALNAVATGALWWEQRARHAQENEVRCIEAVLTPQRETPLSDSQRSLAVLLDCDVPPSLLQREGN
jgi:hypothetical protein